jgi:hypothetical protein
MRFLAAALLFACSALSAQPAEDGSSLESLIGRIEAASSLAIARDDGCPWSQLELETILQTLDLPERMRFQRKITVKKENSIFVLGTSHGNLVESSLRKREMRVRSFSTGEAFAADPDLYHRSYLQRALLLNLALLYYDTLPRERKDEWRAFARWERSLFSGDRPTNVNPEGFAGDSGRRSAGLDFATFACEFFRPPAYKDPLSYVKFRLPDRYAFFSDLFGATPDPLRDLAGAPSFRDWVDPADVEHIEILVTTPTSASPASIAGHSLLLIKRKTDFHDGRDSLVLGFVAETSQDLRNQINPWRYGYRGITGYYPSLIQEESLEELVQRATILENRDVQRFKLNLTEKETARLIERLWVIKNTFTYKYKFFGQNCASMLLDTLNHVFPPGERIELNAPLVAPMHVVARLFHQKRLGEFIYPEYWSLGSKARRASENNQAIRRQILALLREKASRHEAFDRTILGEIESLFGVLFSKGSAELRSDSLFREPILDIDNKGRDLAYERMASLWIALYERYVENEGIITREEYSELTQLLLRFLMNANDREMYIAIPVDIKENYSKSDPIPANVSREYVQKQLQKVQLRQRNSKEMQSLRRAISTLRSHAASSSPDSGMYLVGRDLQQEFAGELAAKRRKIAFTHGYYPTFFSVGYKQADAVDYAVLGLESAVFSEELGHSSIFALKRNLKLVLLGGGFEGAFEPAGRSLLAGHGTVLAVKKILTGERVDYTGWFNQGFGFTLLDSRSILWDGGKLFPGSDSRTKVIEARYILNIFEKDEFRRYLDLETGAGYVFESLEGVSAHYLGLCLALEGKFHIGGNLDNALRFSFSYEPYLDFAGTVLSNIHGSAEIGLGLGRRTNRALYLGSDLGLRLPAMDPPELNCFVRLKLN